MHVTAATHEGMPARYANKGTIAQEWQSNDIWETTLYWWAAAVHLSLRQVRVESHERLREVIAGAFGRLQCGVQQRLLQPRQRLCALRHELLTRRLRKLACTATMRLPTCIRLMEWNMEGRMTWNSYGNAECTWKAL